MLHPALHRLARRFSRGIALVLVAIAGVRCDGDRTEEHRAQPVVVNPDYSQVYSLKDSPDALHTIAIQDPTGKTWYRDEEPALDLSHIKTETVLSIRYPKSDKYGVFVELKPGFADVFSKWVRSHPGGHAGVVVEGHIIEVKELPASTAGMSMRMFAFQASSLDHAWEMREAMRNGGVPLQATSKPAAQSPNTPGTSSELRPRVIQGMIHELDPWPYGSKAADYPEDAWRRLIDLAAALQETEPVIVEWALKDCCVHYETPFVFCERHSPHLLSESL